MWFTPIHSYIHTHVLVRYRTTPVSLAPTAVSCDQPQQQPTPRREETRVRCALQEMVELPGTSLRVSSSHLSRSRGCSASGLTVQMLPTLQHLRRRHPSSCALVRACQRLRAAGRSFGRHSARKKNVDAGLYVVFQTSSLFSALACCCADARLHESPAF